MPEKSPPAPEPPRSPVEAKPAASLLVLRADDAPKVLMGMRGAGHKFMPNRLVFPGGRVDAEDHLTEPATPMPSATQARLARAAEASLVRAIGIAAARELEEETGLSLGWPPALHGFDYLCRAITPEFSPVRFDARFLVVDAAHVAGELAGSGELEDLRWYAIEEALALELAAPTRGVMEQLQLWMAMDDAARAARSMVATLRNRGWELE